jgi:hypothetical protein
MAGPCLKIRCNYAPRGNVRYLEVAIDGVRTLVAIHHDNFVNDDYSIGHRFVAG